ncbi:hypothetical protein ACQP10_08520 [Streptosporangium sandarakinum]|uniref:hypothetical protein n=1 Tax=Streptosporangium sandarakinum TaxID=1260955 RepID=UPI003D90022D
MTYVEGALVAGFAAHVIDRIIAERMGRLLADPRLTSVQRAELEQVKAAIRRAAKQWEQLPVSEETPPAETTPSSELLTTEEAGALLGTTARRARQLAALGMGVKAGGVWLLSRELVLDYREGRRIA